MSGDTFVAVVAVVSGVAVVSVIQILGPYFEAKPCLLKLSSPYLSFLARD